MLRVNSPARIEVETEKIILSASPCPIMDSPYISKSVVERVMNAEAMIKIGKITTAEEYMKLINGLSMADRDAVILANKKK